MSLSSFSRLILRYANSHDENHAAVVQSSETSLASHRSPSSSSNQNKEAAMKTGASSKDVLRNERINKALDFIGFCILTASFSFYGFGLPELWAFCGGVAMVILGTGLMIYSSIRGFQA